MIDFDLVTIVISTVLFLPSLTSPHLPPGPGGLHVRSDSGQSGHLAVRPGHLPGRGQWWGLRSHSRPPGHDAPQLQGGQQPQDQKGNKTERFKVLGFWGGLTKVLDFSISYMELSKSLGSTLSI